MPGSGCPTQWASDFMRLVEGLVDWSGALTEPNDCVSVLVGNVKRASVPMGGDKSQSAVLGLSPATVGFWLRDRQTPTLSSLLRLGYAFDIPLEHWFTSSMLSFPAPRPIPDVPWLMDRANAVDSTVESALLAALESPRPMSLLAVAEAISASHRDLFHAHPDLAKCIAERYRQHRQSRRWRMRRRWRSSSALALPNVWSVAGL